MKEVSSLGPKASKLLQMLSSTMLGYRHRPPALAPELAGKTHNQVSDMTFDDLTNLQILANNIGLIIIANAYIEYWCDYRKS